MEGGGFSHSVCRRRWTLAASRPVHDHCNADERDNTAQQIEAVRFDSVDAPSPQDGERDEDAAVSGIDAPEVRRLESWDDAIEKESDPAGKAVDPGSPFSQPEPDEVSAANLAEPSEDEEDDRPEDLHHDPMIVSDANSVGTWLRRN